MLMSYFRAWIRLGPVRMRSWNHFGAAMRDERRKKTHLGRLKESLDGFFLEARYARRGEPLAKRARRKVRGLRVQSSRLVR
jgi:hypothetical protein